MSEENDEARMTKEAPNPNDEIAGRLWQTPWRFAETPGQIRASSLILHFSIRHSFELRHSGFVIAPVCFGFRYSIFEF
jgi:hypothetical protein